MKKKYNIKGMHCKSCELLLEKNISQVQGVRKVEVSQKRGIAEVHFTDGQVNDDGIARAVQSAGYTLGVAGKPHWLSHDTEAWFEVMLGVSALSVLWMAATLAGVWTGFGIKFGAAPTYPVVFVIGLTAGISTCMAVVGGLVASFSASYAETHQYATRWQRFEPNLFFNAGRVISYAVLGGAVGALGSVVKLSSGFTGFLVLVAGMVMLYMGLKLTDISPKISNTSFTLPKKLGRMLGMYEQSGGYSHKEAFIGGAFTFFLPCGFTQAMQLYAITTGSFVSGAIIMGLFALGTMPGLLGVGAITSVLQGKKARTLFRFVGLVVVVLGLINIANGATLSGIPLPSVSGGGLSAAAPLAPVEDGEQVVNMMQTADGYSPNNFTVKVGVPVKWVIDSKDAFTCAASIRMPAFKIAQFLQEGQNVITFTPTQAGAIPFSCGMGMYRGNFTAVD